MFLVGSRSGAKRVCCVKADFTNLFCYVVAQVRGDTPSGRGEDKNSKKTGHSPLPYGFSPRAPLPHLPSPFVRFFPWLVATRKQNNVKGGEMQAEKGLHFLCVPALITHTRPFEQLLINVFTTSASWLQTVFVGWLGYSCG